MKRKSEYGGKSSYFSAEKALNGLPWMLPNALLDAVFCQQSANASWV
jgi:hypothetical protein